MESYDIAVIGLGGIGSATAWFAARSGLSIIGLEQFDLGGHNRGASHDHSRIIRHSYHTAHYVELTRHAYDAWRDVEGASGETCIHVTGGIDLFPRGAAIDVDTYRDSMRACEIAFDELTAAEVMSRWPAWRLDDDTDVLYQADTGIVSPATTLPLLQRLAGDRGAVLRGNTAVAGIEPDDGVARIHLADGQVLDAASVVIAADAWTASLVEPLGVKLPLTVTREQVTYYETDSPHLFERDHFPVWIWMDDASFYGFPTFGRPGVKVAEDCGGQPVDPDRRGFDPDPAILERTDSFTAAMFAGRVRAPSSTTTCLYTLPPDRDFVVDALPDHPNIHVALGAGHGYKFVAWFGKTLAALASDRNACCDLTPFRLDRPALTDPSWTANWLV
ncbi:MAG TPA: N-methyl-L-tryptophan oxidase [Ilumatobacteraceae bacterium]